MDIASPPFGPGDLKQQAMRLRRTAFHVFNRQLAQRLESEAEELEARAEAMAAGRQSPLIR
jgi:hypothetical protein